MEVMKINHSTPTLEERKREIKVSLFHNSFWLYALFALLILNNHLGGMTPTYTNDNYVSVCTCRVQWSLAEVSELLTEFVLDHLCVSFNERIIFSFDPNILSASWLENWEAELTAFLWYSWNARKSWIVFFEKVFLSRYIQFSSEEGKTSQEIGYLVVIGGKESFRGL